jgi:hypothetical protein
MTSIRDDPIQAKANQHRTMQDDRRAELVESLCLLPELDVTTVDGDWISASSEPWLRFATATFFHKNHIFEMTYRASLFDDPVRPIVRFVTDAGVIDRVLPGPVAGAGVWIGVTPDNIVDVLISPAARPGRFGFVIEKLRALELGEIVARVRGKSNLALFHYWRRKLLGRTIEAENTLNWAVGAEPLRNFPSWRAARVREPDVGGLDRPRFDWREGAKIGVIVFSDGVALDRLGETIASIRSQLYSRFVACVVATEADVRRRVEQAADPRFVCVGSLEAAKAHLRSCDLLLHLVPGDALEPCALACVAEEARRGGAAAAVY